MAAESGRYVTLEPMSHAEDDDHRRFLRLEGAHNADGEEAVVSVAAFQLHGFGTIRSVEGGHPGFVSDEYMNAISAETTITAAELCTAGMWERAEGGYKVLDQEMVDHVVSYQRKMDGDAEFCQATGGHEPSEEDPDLCRKRMTCHPTAEDWPADKRQT
jgi:hypothetical protein